MTDAEDFWRKAWADTPCRHETQAESDDCTVTYCVDCHATLAYWSETLGRYVTIPEDEETDR